MIEEKQFAQMKYLLFYPDWFASIMPGRGGGIGWMAEMIVKQETAYCFGKRYCIT